MADSKQTAVLIMLIGLLCLYTSLARASNSVWVIEVKGAIGPATADHLVRGLNQAQQAEAGLVVLQIDTPGGLDTAMRQIIQAVLASTTPLACYVAPGGARAASAGTYILYACHIAAMAPATNLGAATPVQIGTPSLPQLPGNQDKQDETAPAKAGTAMERKIINDATAYLQSLAKLRGRNSEWAGQAVREGASLTAEQALALNVINIVADDLDDLLAQLDNYSISINGNSITLTTKDAEIYQHPFDWRSEFLSVITDPNIAYILMLIGIYGLIFEFSNPGLVAPGVLGAVCILLALYAFQVLPVSYAGLALMILGIGLMVAEAFAPSFGILGMGGIIAFVFGSIILMDTETPGYQIAMPVIVAFATFSAATLVFALSLVFKARRQTVVTGLPHLIGATAVVDSIHDREPLVRLEGELWQVDCDQPLQINDKVTITAADGIVLTVEKDNGDTS